MVTNTTIYTRQLYVSLSSDTPDVVFHNGDEVYLIDTRQRIIYDEENSTWYPLPTGGGGDTVYQTSRGHLYTKNIQIETNNANFDPTYLSGQFAYATQMETARLFGTPFTSGTALQSTFDGCSNLHTAIIEQIKRYSNYVFSHCPSLKNVQLGSVGCGVTSIYNSFSGLTQQNLTITIYVDDEVTVPLANSPWGATNATIIYRSSTTGEVLA